MSCLAPANARGTTYGGLGNIDILSGLPVIPLEYPLDPFALFDAGLSDEEAVINEE